MVRCLTCGRPINGEGVCLTCTERTFTPGEQVVFWKKNGTDFWLERVEEVRKRDGYVRLTGKATYVNPQKNLTLIEDFDRTRAARLSVFSHARLPVLRREIERLSNRETDLGSAIDRALAMVGIYQLASQDAAHYLVDLLAIELPDLLTEPITDKEALMLIRLPEAYRTPYHFLRRRLMDYLRV